MILVNELMADSVDALERLLTYRAPPGLSDIVSRWQDWQQQSQG